MRHRSLVALLAIGGLAACHPVLMGPAGSLGEGVFPPRRLAAAGHQALVVSRDGRLWEWGLDPLMTVTNLKPARSRPVGVATLSGVRDMAAGEDGGGIGTTAHLLSVRQDGTVWAWGANDEGQGGYDKRASDSPVQVQDLSGITAVDAGWRFSLALKSDGSVWAWGRNTFGQLGEGSQVKRERPVQVSGLLDVAMVRAGRMHALALTRDGRVWGWGANFAGQLALPPATDAKPENADRIATPTVVPGLRDVVEIAAGGDFSVARLADGSVKAWGSGRDGQLGVRITSGRPLSRVPVIVPGLANVKTLVAGNSHVLALLNDGRVWSWGSNHLGELGRGTLGFDKSEAQPNPVAGLAEVVSIAAGRDFSLALDRNGQVWAWGNNYGGQLGQGMAKFEGQVKPVAVKAPTGEVAWKVDD